MSETDVRSVHGGGCHCGSVRWQFVSPLASASFVPRACDCDFCSRHRAAWISDPAGALRIRTDEESLQRYRQGSGQAEFLLCRRCGVLVAVVVRDEGGRLLGAANRNAFDSHVGFANETIVSPRLLAADAKLARWNAAWMPTELRTG